MKIGKVSIRDGAMAGANNPVKRAYEEVKHMHWKHEPAVIISIGTGIRAQRKHESSPRKSRAWLPAQKNIQDFFDAGKTFRDRLLETEETHKAFHQTIRNANRSTFPKRDDEDKNPQDIMYMRLNVPAEYGLQEVKLGEWSGTKEKPGSATKTKINEAVEKYLRDDRTQQQLQECAKKLVLIRRERQMTQRWEQFALNIVYCCRERKCQHHNFKFESRLKLRDHAFRTHGFVWKIPCEDGSGRTVHPYTCVWAHCEETKVTVFENETEFTDHLRTIHGLEDPQIKTREQLERWLDMGRELKPPRLSRWQTDNFRF